MALDVGDQVWQIERQSAKRFPYTPPKERWGKTIAAGTNDAAFSTLFGFNLNDVEIAALDAENGQVHVGLVITFYWDDVFDNIYSEDFGFMGQLSRISPSLLRPFSVDIYETQEQLANKAKDA